MKTQANIKGMYWLTEAKDHSKLYSAIDNMVEKLRSEGFEDKDIKKGILYFVGEIIDEQ